MRSIEPGTHNPNCITHSLRPVFIGPGLLAALASGDGWREPCSRPAHVSWRFSCPSAAYAALFAFFRFTLLGKAIRACADNYDGARVVGLNVKRLYALTFGLGAACVGAAGAMLMVVTDVTPAIGPAYTLLAFVIVITGGLGSMPGALLGGLLIGLTEALGGVLFTPSAKTMFAFALLVLVLLFRPQGILGRKAP